MFIFLKELLKYKRNRYFEYKHYCFYSNCISATIIDKQIIDIGILEKICPKLLME